MMPAMYNTCEERRTSEEKPTSKQIRLKNSELAMKILL